MSLTTRIEKLERQVAAVVAGPRQRSAFFVLTRVRVCLGVISRDQVDGMLVITEPDTDAGTFAYITMVLSALLDNEVAYDECKARYFERQSPPFPWPTRTGDGYLDGHPIDAAIATARARIASNQEGIKS